jgi:hypothetical protein
MTDDDDYGMPGQFILPLAPNSLIDSSLISKFAPAYIQVVPAPSNQHPTVPFGLNRPGVDVTSTAIDIPTTTETCWTHYVLAAYQPNEDEDFDPSSELNRSPGVTFGKTILHMTDVYLETMRDNQDTDLRKPGNLAIAQTQVLEDFRILVAHEVAQSAGTGTGPHPFQSEGGIMNEGSFHDETVYSPTILRFRRSLSFYDN